MKTLRIFMNVTGNKVNFTFTFAPAIIAVILTKSMHLMVVIYMLWLICVV